MTNIAFTGTNNPPSYGFYHYCISIWQDFPSFEHNSTVYHTNDHLFIWLAYSDFSKSSIYILYLRISFYFNCRILLNVMMLVIRPRIGNFSASSLSLSLSLVYYSFLFFE